MANEFEWEDAAASEDFFSQVEVDTTETSAQAVLEKISEDDVDSEENSDETSTENSNDLFETFDEEAEEEEEDGLTPVDTESVPSTNVSLLNSMKQKGLIEFELEEGEELTEELAEELLEDKYEETIEERINEKLMDLPEDAQELIKFVLKGGSINQYVNAVGSTVQLTEDLDLEEESNQELAIRQLLREEGEDDEFIETQLELLKESGKMHMYAEKKFNKWVEEQKTEKESLLKRQAEHKKEIVRNIREAKKEVSNTLSSLTDIGGLTPSKEDKKQLPSYINDRSVKLANGGEISEMQKELFYELPKNKIATMQLAILLRNRNEDGSFNFENIAKNINTEITNKIKKELRRDNTNIPNSASKKGGREGRSLADIFS